MYNDCRIGGLEMEILKFKCRLLSDVILNQKAATEGPNKTLDFIPGSCFLGIAASQLYKKYGECRKTIDLFHSNKVFFGDAHPSSDNMRGLKIPASMFYPKLKKPSEELYIHHLVPNLKNDVVKKKQLKQCRLGFYTFADKIVKKVGVETNFAIKSAYDKDKRRSKDEQMYGYESLVKGLILYFEVHFEDNSLVQDVKDALLGAKRVGRSRTAQYGLVDIEFLESGYDECESKKDSFTIMNEDGKECQCVTVYADGRLIFLDEFGLPMFRPKAKDLGIDEGEILWSLSQVRTFQYSPWNFTRQCFDADRCGIEKGSVFVVKTSISPDQSMYVGSFKNEGFGKVIYNPAFLMANENGEAVYRFEEDKNFEDELSENEKELRRKEIVKNEIEVLKSQNGLLRYLGCRKEEEDRNTDVYKIVNGWVKKYEKNFKGDSFASQWGTIRNIAMTIGQRKPEESVKEYLVRKLYGTEDAYLMHGVAAEKWKDKERKKVFAEFCKNLTSENAQIAIINLAAEMAKKSKEDR